MGLFQKIKSWWADQNLPDDWVLVDSEYGEWIDDLFGGRKYCYYDTYLSKSRNELKLVCYGYKPKKHKIFAPIKKYFIQDAVKYKVTKTRIV